MKVTFESREWEGSDAFGCWKPAQAVSTTDNQSWCDKYIGLPRIGRRYQSQLCCPRRGLRCLLQNGLKEDRWEIVEKTKKKESLTDTTVPKWSTHLQEARQIYQSIKSIPSVSYLRNATYKHSERSWYIKEIGQSRDCSIFFKYPCRHHRARWAARQLLLHFRGQIIGSNCMLWIVAADLRLGPSTSSIRDRELADETFQSLQLAVVVFGSLRGTGLA